MTRLVRSTLLYRGRSPRPGRRPRRGMGAGRAGAVLALAVGACAVAATPARAQEGAPDARAFAGGGFLVASPIGEFADNVGTGFGVGLYGRLVLDPAGVLSLRGDVGLLNYGNETIQICVSQPCRVTGELTTSNNIVFGGVGPEVAIGNRAIRIYANAVAGFAYFATTSSIEGENEEAEPFASSTNFEDLTFAWIAGGGIQSFIWRGSSTAVRLDLGIRYHGNGEAEYLRRGDIDDLPDGSVVTNPRRSGTKLWTLQLGASVEIPSGR